MRLFIDSANLDDIRQAMASGAVSGVTTNPSIMAKEPKGEFDKHLQKIADLVGHRPISAEVVAGTPESMVQEALALVGTVDGNIDIKVPMSWDNMRVIDCLVDHHIRVNATCLFTEQQAIMALNAGASYVSLFYNRARDLSVDTFRWIDSVRNLIDKDYGGGTYIICGSIRSAEDVRACAMAGAHIVTASLPIIKAMCTHPGTDVAVDQFNRDFASWLEV